MVYTITSCIFHGSPHGDDMTRYSVYIRLARSAAGWPLILCLPLPQEVGGM